MKAFRWEYTSENVTVGGTRWFQKQKQTKKKIIFLNNVKDPNTGTRCHKMNSWEAQQHYEAGEWPVAFFISLGAFRMA